MAHIWHYNFLTHLQCWFLVVTSILLPTPTKYLLKVETHSHLLTLRIQSKLKHPIRILRTEIDLRYTTWQNNKQWAVSIQWQNLLNVFIAAFFMANNEVIIKTRHLFIVLRYFKDLTTKMPMYICIEKIRLWIELGSFWEFFGNKFLREHTYNSYKMIFF